MLMAVDGSSDPTENKFIIDSGATNHMVTSDRWMSPSASKIERRVTIGNGQSVPVRSVGSLKIRTNRKNLGSHLICI